MKLRVIIAGTALVAGCASPGQAAVAASAPPAPRPSIITVSATPIIFHVRAGCVTFDVTGKPAVGMPWDEPVTFCAPGLPTGTYLCPAKTPVSPGTLLHCSKER